MFTIIGADGIEYGPVTTANITGWIAAGRANLQTKARREGETEWKPLSDFAEFAAPPVLTTAVIPTMPAASPVPVASPAGPELASRWLRLGAYLVDGLIGGICFAPGFVLLGMAGVFARSNTPNMPMLFGGVAALGAAVLILLAIQIYLLTTRGQTIGKKLLGIKIVSFDAGTNPGFVKVVLLRSVVNAFFAMVPFIGFLYSLTDILFIFREDRRCIHDLLAGTRVVPVASSNSFTQ